MSATSRASTMGIIALLLRDKNICPLQDVSGWGITIPAWPKFSLLLSEISSPIGAFSFSFSFLLFFFSSNNPVQVQYDDETHEGAHEW